MVKSNSANNNSNKSKPSNKKGLRHHQGKSLEEFDEEYDYDDDIAGEQKLRLLLRKKRDEQLARDESLGMYKVLYYMAGSTLQRLAQQSEILETRNRNLHQIRREIARYRTGFVGSGSNSNSINNTRKRYS